LLLCLALVLSVLASCDIIVTLPEDTQTETESTEGVETSSKEEAPTESDAPTSEETASESTEATSEEDTEASNGEDTEGATESADGEDTYESAEETSDEDTEKSTEITDEGNTSETTESTSETAEATESTSETAEATESTDEGEESSESCTEGSTESKEETSEREEQTTETEEETTESEKETTESEKETTESEEETTDTEEKTTESEEETSEDQPDCTHKDNDNNGQCDLCYISVIIEFDLYAINDLHGKILDNGSQPGVDELTTYLKNARKNNPNTILFSSGDMWQGTGESGLTYGGITIDWMNELDFAFMTIGNHEFDWSESYVSQNSNKAEFPFLAINIYDSTTRRLEEYCQPSIMIDLGEIQIGFIGAIGNCYSSISGEMRDGFYFVTGTQLTTLVKNEAQRLRGAGADFIVYSLHDETAGCDISLTRDGYVDIVFEGHSHQSYANRDSNGVYHIQGGGENKGISYASVSFNFANLKKEVEARVISSSVYSACAPDDVVDRLSDKYSEEVSLSETVLGTNDATRNSTYISNLVAKTYTALAETHWTGYNVVLGGGKISCRSPYNLYTGQVKYGDLYTLLPFNNKLALCSIKGSYLLSRYINNSDYYISYTAYGESVKGNIDSNATYYIITDSYNYTYSWNNLTVVEIYDEVTYARDLVAEYVKKGGLDAPRQGGGTNTPDTPTPEMPSVSLTSIPELIEIAKGLGAGGETSTQYYVKGKITSIVNTKYGNMYIEDESGNELYIYGLYKSGVRFDGLSDKPKVGDTVILYGKMANYTSSGSTTYEMKNAELIYKE